MKILDPLVCFIEPPTYDSVLRKVEMAGRTCYKSDSCFTRESAEKFIGTLISKGHESVLEHASLTVRFTCDRGVSHELVRHRIASYSQESTRYCNYSKDKFGGEISVIRPCFLEKGTSAWAVWEDACETAENAYFSLLHTGCSPEQARAVLPNSLKTEVVMTANMREWRHFIRMRATSAAHPQMREIALLLVGMLRAGYPVFFKDLFETRP